MRCACMRIGNMKLNGDFHLHTFASDGRCSIFAHAKKAVALGFDTIAITDHSFASFIFHMTRKKFAKQTAQIKRCSNVRVLHGVEANIVNANGDLDVPKDIIEQCDILHIGFHRFLDVGHMAKDFRWLVTNGYSSKKKRELLIEQNTQAYINALRKYPVDCVAHLNHRALVDVKQVCLVAKEVGAYIELNAKHLDALEDCAQDILESGVNLLCGTDAHDTKKLGQMSNIVDFVQRHNIPLERVFGVNDNLPIFKDKKDFV